MDISCTNQAAVVGLRYTLIAVVDHAADDLASCGAGDLLTATCFNDLADDDDDPNDNRVSRSAPRVKKPQVE